MRSIIELSLRAESGANFFIFVSSLGLPKTAARVLSSSSTAEKKAVRRDGGRKLIAYSTYNNESTKVQNPRRMYGLASDGVMTMQMMIPKCNCIE